MFRRFLLSNGLRVVAERMPAHRSVTVGVWVNVGSRDEGPGEEGLSHFLEHMFFKGTRTRSAADISHEIDALGGELNAFTTRETTTFYVKVLEPQLKPALALLADLFLHSRFLPREVEKEKEVVLDELRMVQDDPEDFVQELHAEQAMAPHPLARPILGRAATIKALDRGSLLRYVGTHYHPGRTIIAVAGRFEVKNLVPWLEASFGAFDRPDGPGLRRWPPVVRGGLLVRRKPLEQAHLCLGLTGVPVTHKDRYAAHALNAVLGGSVSSRLFQEVREKRGLAYSIYSYLASYSDGGLLTVYAATRPREAARVLELICRQIRRLREDGVTRTELDRAKTQMKGGLLLSLESTHSRMNHLAKDELHWGRRSSPEALLAEIDQISTEQVARVADELLDAARLSITVLGPVSERAVAAAIR